MIYHLLPKGSRLGGTPHDVAGGKNPLLYLSYRVAPAKAKRHSFPAYRKPVPCKPPLSSHLGPAVMTEPGQRHFGNTDAYGSHTSSKTSWGHCYSLKNSQDPRDGLCWQSESKWHLRCQLNRCSSSSSALPLLVGLPV